MTNWRSRRDPVDRLAEEFARRCRVGEQPSVEQYAKDHPEFASQIQNLFPAIVMLEKFRGLEAVARGITSMMTNRY